MSLYDLELDRDKLESREFLYAIGSLAYIFSLGELVSRRIIDCVAAAHGSENVRIVLRAFKLGGFIEPIPKDISKAIMFRVKNREFFKRLFKDIVQMVEPKEMTEIIICINS